MPNYEFPRPLTEEALHQLLSTHPDFSNKRVTLSTATITLSAEKHADRTLLFNKVDGVTVTLPKASGSGHKYKFVIQATFTSSNCIIKVGNTTDIIQGLLMVFSDNAAQAVIAWEAGGTDDTITLNRGTTGTAKVGHWIELEDIASGVWAVRGQIGQSGTEATPFSATV
jgi:hypothetical protein